MNVDKKLLKICKHTSLYGIVAVLVVAILLEVFERLGSFSNAQERIIVVSFVSILGLVLITGIVLLIISLITLLVQIFRRQQITDIFLCIGLSCLMVIVCLVTYVNTSGERPRKTDVCKIRLRHLFFILNVYNENNNSFPTPDMWCDALVPYTQNKDIFYCYDPSNNAHMFALNPEATPNSEDNVVLLFESTGPWNAHGQSELLYIRDYKRKTGCFVLFCSGKVEFVQESQINELQWGESHSVIDVNSI